MSDMGFWDVLYLVPKEDVISLLFEYDKYIQNGDEEILDGSFPLSVEDFSLNEYRLTLDDEDE
jgi:hypothetical protein